MAFTAAAAAVYYSSLDSSLEYVFLFKDTVVVVFIRPLSLVLVVRIWRESGGLTLKGFSAVAPLFVREFQCQLGIIFRCDTTHFRMFGWIFCYSYFMPLRLFNCAMVCLDALTVHMLLCYAMQPRHACPQTVSIQEDGRQRTRYTLLVHLRAL